MGAGRSDRGDQVGGRSLKPAARVVPDVATFAVDDGFWYSVPPQMRPILDVGSIVRVPLSGRRVRGWVVECADREGTLKDVLSVSSEIPVFDGKLLEVLGWAANHYVAPLAVLLSKAGPPNLPGPPDPVPVDDGARSGGRHPLGDAASSAAAGQRRPVMSLVGRWQDPGQWLPSLAPALESGTVLVVAATAVEVAWIAESAQRFFGSRVVSVPTEPDAAITAAWEQAQGHGLLVVGTPRSGLWQLPHLVLAVVLEEGRRAMKERQTPTLHVRDVIRTRARIEGFASVFFGPTPSVELLAAGSEVVKVGNRAWGLVEVVDRSGDPPGSGLVSGPVVAAMRAVGSTAGERTFVLTTAPMVDRVVTELTSRLGRGSFGPHPDGIVGSVGTERDLAGLEPVALTVAANVDGLLMGRSYRASEEALRQLARLGNSLAPGRGRRMMVQTEKPGSDLIETLRRGDPMPYLERVLVERARAGAPPSTEMIAIELRGSVPAEADSEIRSLPDADVHGPVAVDGNSRWLLVGRLRKARRQLRPLVGHWRDQGTTVRVDADPIDL